MKSDGTARFRGSDRSSPLLFPFRLSLLGRNACRPAGIGRSARPNSPRRRLRLPGRRQGGHDRRGPSRRLRLDAGHASSSSTTAASSWMCSARPANCSSRRRRTGSAAAARSPPCPSRARSRPGSSCPPTCRRGRSAGRSPTPTAPADNGYLHGWRQPGSRRRRAAARDRRQLPDLPVVVSGRLLKNEEVDRYRFRAPRDGPVTCALTARRLAPTSTASSRCATTRAGWSRTLWTPRGWTRP